MGLVPGPVKYPVDYRLKKGSKPDVLVELESRSSHTRLRGREPTTADPRCTITVDTVTQQECDPADQEDGPCAPRSPKAKIAAIIAAAAAVAQKAEEQRALLEAAAMAEVQSKEERA
ncbi:hypothetical protein EDB86DRAFT_3241329 [Lactarius hatsudake]|nr:hypothetical protein EDB86DRAFT_3241329 [Lactarius hatsudake]